MLVAGGLLREKIVAIGYRVRLERASAGGGIAFQGKALSKIGSVSITRGRRGNMSWTCHGQSNEEMVAKLQQNAIVGDERVVEAMMRIDRAEYVLQRGDAYQDSPQLIGFNATISAPHMHGYCLSLLSAHLHAGMRVLDVGSGSGYLLAVMALLVGSGGRAVGMEHIPELADRSVKAIANGAAGPLLANGTGDGRAGMAKFGPYDAIHVGAAAPDFPHQLVCQLKPGGRLLCPLGDVAQVLEVIDKHSDGSIHRHSAMSVRYVPLTAKEAQLG